MNALLLYVFLDVIAFSSIIIAVLPFHVMFLGAGPFIVTLYISIFSFIQFFVSPYLGKLSDKFGRKPMLLSSSCADFASHLIMAFANTLPLVLISRVIAGCFSCNLSVGSAYISDITNENERTKYIGRYNSAYSLGFAIGPIVGGYLAGNNPLEPNYFASGIFAASINFINIFILFFLLKKTKKVAVKFKSTNYVKQIYEIITKKEVSYLFYLYFLINFVFSGLNGIFALWSEKVFNWGPQQIGTLMCFVGILLAFHQSISINYFVKKFKEKITALISIFFIFIGIFLLTITETYILLSCAVFFCTFGIGMFNPTINSLISQKINKDQTGSALSINQSALSISRFSGQPFSGLFFQTFSYNAPLYIGLCLLGITQILYAKKLANKID